MDTAEIVAPEASSGEGGVAARPQGGRSPVVWFEVEDFLRFFDHFAHPAGLQRPVLEILSDAERRYRQAGRARYCRLSLYTRHFETLDFATFHAAYAKPLGLLAPWPAMRSVGRWSDKLPRVLKALARSVPYFWRIATGFLRDVFLSRWMEGRFARTVAPGDVVVSFGASWINATYAKNILAAKRRYGIKFCTTIHDLIPIDAPQMVQWHQRIRYRRWIDSIVPASDAIFTVSAHSRDAILELCRRRGWPAPPVIVLPLGSSLRPSTSVANVRDLLPQRFALFVSTLEIRKNHRFLLRVWQRLIARHGADAVPTLVFVGRVGWLAAELVSELNASDCLDGKVVVLSDLTDGELREAYRRCLFTVFPSLYEGWGSPVAESLELGKFCVASKLTSLPEVGGSFADYFDPTDEADAQATIERVLFEPGYLEAREAYVREQYRPKTWSQCVDAVLRTADAL
jgi:glycosyltransferase involved in cell wall biosynthesis